MINCAIIIPALNPSESLIDYVKTLLAAGFARIIVVNDGSKEELSYIFTEIGAIEGCKVLSHNINKGKGRALKTAFSYFLKEEHDLAGVITADADGQHSAEDVFKVADEFEKNVGDIILGVRDFSEPHVPVRSYLGNRFTSFIFLLLFRRKLRDTQTGLRGIPKKELKWIVELKGERYEYEINMLLTAVKRKMKLHEIRIQTLYFNNNSESHYRSIVDSLKVFKKLIIGLFSSGTNH